jgi:hypothetical protein
MGKAGEKQKRTPKIKDKRQYERFVETARKLGCDEREEAFEREFVKIVPPKTIKPTGARSRQGARRLSS